MRFAMASNRVRTSGCWPFVRGEIMAGLNCASVIMATVSPQKRELHSMKASAYPTLDLDYDTFTEKTSGWNSWRRKAAGWKRDWKFPFVVAPKRADGGLQMA